MRKYTNSIGKPDQGCINEDAVLERKNLIAVSDGAGGGGLFAEEWSAYLLSHLPTTPICSADELDAWIGDIWEPTMTNVRRMPNYWAKCIWISFTMKAPSPLWWQYGNSPNQNTNG